MNWENLKKNNCPHCGESLREVGAIFNCTVCFFTISTGRKMAIETHRANPENATIKLKWQNLREEKCPMCGDALNYGIGPYEVLACMSNPECTFKIRHDRYLEILHDHTHPANQFYEREKLQKHGIQEE